MREGAEPTRPSPKGASQRKLLFVAGSWQRVRIARVHFAAHGLHCAGEDVLIAWCSIVASEREALVEPNESSHDTRTDALLLS